MILLHFKLCLFNRQSAARQPITAAGGELTKGQLCKELFGPGQHMSKVLNDSILSYNVEHCYILQLATLLSPAKLND